MRLGDFKVGDKVWYPEGVDIGPSRYSVIRYVGELWVVLRPEIGNEYAESVGRNNLELWKPSRIEEVLKRLGDDLVSAIQNADQAYLRKPTWHMSAAIEKWKEATNGL